MKTQTILISIRIISLILILIGIVYYTYILIRSKKNHLIPQKDKNNLSKESIENPRFCILIPARDESKVIENLLVSIQNQSYNQLLSDVYIIVEDPNDKTIAIAKKYHANILLRKNLNHKRKGYALDEALQEILLTKKYDAYYIFDADNILDQNYLLEMKKTYDQGYDIGIGYRNCKNGNDNVISACSALTFSMINTLSNKRKMKNTNTLTISGTGFYIKGKIVEQWRGYPFHSLTEDYELTLYATINNLTTSYNEKAIFYDEQATTYQVTKNQRIRWIRGYFDCRKKYIQSLKKSKNMNNPNYGSILTEIAGVTPVILLLIGFLLLFISSIILSILDQFTFMNIILTTILFLLIIYLLLSLFTALLIVKEKKQLSLTNITKLKTILFNPIYLITYIPCAVKALTAKEITWDKIVHNRN